LSGPAPNGFIRYLRSPGESVGSIRRDAEQRLQPAARQPRGHDLVEDEDDAVLGACGAKLAKKFRIAGQVAAGVPHRLDDDRGHALAMLIQNAFGGPKKNRQFIAGESALFAIFLKAKGLQWP
jgi:hypothetical protein